jgi:hypothetical protein
MSDPKLAELIAMSGRAMEGPWTADDVATAASCFKLETKFIAELVNWFRETYTKERA